MRLSEMEQAVRQNVEKLLSTFHKNPAIFLSEADVQAYLYSLLINDPMFSKNLVEYEDERLTKKSCTSLVHLELQLEDDEARASKRVDISILKPHKTFDSSELLGAIGIEIKYNRKKPASDEASSIIQDIEKISEYYQKGYILWLNWDRWMHSDHLKEVKKVVMKKKYRQKVRLYYIDCYSNPIKRSRNLCKVLKV